MNTKSQGIRSPFKFLKSYQPEEKNIFFGRDREIDELYGAIKLNRIVILFGESGTGKSSLVRSGLARRLDTCDWEPFYVVPGANLINSLRDTLSHSAAWGGAYINKEQIPDAVATIGNRMIRPVYLIFDQFEDYLISLNSRNKQRLQEFTKVLQDILNLDTHFPCHFIFVVRDDSFGKLSLLEKEMPGFLNKRIRLELMQEKEAIDVVEQSCEQFNIKLESGRIGAEKIVEKASIDPNISLPYLQVYLDHLWREDFERTYPGQFYSNEGDEGYPSLLFEDKEIEDFGNIEDVLKTFIKERIREIDYTLQTAFPNTSGKYTERLLDSFVTNDGIKQPLSFYRKDNLIIPDEKSPKVAKDLPTLILTFLLDKLEKSRLIVENSSCYELVHDVLSKPILEMRSHDVQLYRELEGMVKSSYYTNSKTEKGTLLTEEQITLILPHQSKLDLQREHLAFIETSRIAIADAKMIEDETRSTQLRAERRMNRKLMITLITVAFFALIAIFFALMFDQRNKEIKEINEKLSNQNIELTNLNKVIENKTITDISRLSESTYRYLQELKYEQAFQELDSLFTLKKSILIDSLHAFTYLQQNVIELGFFYYELGEVEKTSHLLAKYNQWSVDTIRNEKVREELQKIDSTRFNQIFYKFYPEVQLVPGNIYSMGCDSVGKIMTDGPGCLSRSFPQHLVQIDSFRIGVTEITLRQYNLYCKMTKGELPAETLIFGRNGDLPVVNISWVDAVEYTNWLSSKNGYPPAYQLNKYRQVSTDSIPMDWKYRLPTEAEWEFAARGGAHGQNTIYAGSDQVVEVAHSNCETSGNCKTKQVRSNKSNELGLFDMSGNVWEFCQDQYDKNAYKISQDSISINPIGPNFTKNGRVLRGGCYISKNIYCTVAVRYHVGQATANKYNGFRVVLARN